MFASPNAPRGCRARARAETKRSADLSLHGGLVPPWLRDRVVRLGAGSAGRAVAASLVAQGTPPLVLDRTLRPPPVEGAELLAATTAVFLPPPVETGDHRFTLLAYREPAQGVRLLARSVVVATGSYDASLLFGGNDRPGVITADAAFALAASRRPPPFRRAAVVGGGHRAAQLLEAFGDRVDAVVAPGEIRPEVVRVANEHGVLLYPRSLLLTTVGRRHIRSVRLRSRGGKSRPQRRTTSSSDHAAAASGSSRTKTCKWLFITVKPAMETEKI